MHLPGPVIRVLEEGTKRQASGSAQALPEAAGRWWALAGAGMLGDARDIPDTVWRPLSAEPVKPFEVPVTFLLPQTFTPREQKDLESILEERPV